MAKYNFLTEEQFQKLLDNGAPEKTGKDHVPVVKLFTPDAQGNWLLTEIVPDEPEIAFGLCDLGFGCPELGYVSLTELIDVRGGLGLPIERDTYFDNKYPLSAYVEAARLMGRITDDPGLLENIMSSRKVRMVFYPPKPS